MTMSSLEDRSFELYNINYFSRAFPLSHQGVLLTEIANYEEYLKTLASPPQEIDPGQPKTVDTFNYMFKNEKRMKDDEAVQFTAGHQKQMKHPGEPKGHSSSKRRRIATVTHDVHEKKMENSQTPPGGFFSKSASLELMNMAEDGIPLNQVDSLSDDFTRLKKDGPIHKPGDNALIGGTKNCSVSAGDSKVTAMSSKGTVPNKAQMSPAMAQKINDDIKYQLMKEVRKFGRSK
ncbi:hypothetical protein FD754_020602 [Muntiacus muntjak]|uniref:Uncharacterized protein n=1 Tax=Muntiacus muntjak TaxID=9888 RepID=A0A5N3V3D3_MUNMU|nr:hypothetical protein FD754_020602 [Muntiacus muntjak]